MFISPEDSSAPVFTTLGDSIKFIVDANLVTELALRSAISDLINFINSVVADSTDFQETLDNFATAVGVA